MSLYRQLPQKRRYALTVCAMVFIALFLFLLKGRESVTILMYHNLSPEEAHCESAWTMQPEKLREDLQWLSDHGYETVLPRELAAQQRDDGSPLPKKMVMLTFDDGYESNYTYAYPILREYGAKAAVALIVGHIDTGGGFLTWDECREMEQSGLFEFGSHTYDHHIREEANGVERLAGETQADYAQRIGSDLDESIRVLRRELGHEPVYFAYPLGKIEPWADELLRERFAVTVTSREGRADLSRGTYQLPRYNVTQTTRAEKFVR